MGFVHYKRGLGKEASLSHCAHAQLEPGNGSSPGSPNLSRLGLPIFRLLEIWVLHKLPVQFMVTLL